MDEQKQKTVVAFVVGLLIGGLLVWIFSITPDNKKSSDTKNTSEFTENTDENASDTNKATSSEEKKDEVISTGIVVENGSGSIVVEDQSAGLSVAIASVLMPVSNGWIVVHEINDDGTLSNILGAARFSESEDLMPKSVELLRTTKAGATYKVVIYGGKEDRLYDKVADMPITMTGGYRIEDSFVAK